MTNAVEIAALAECEAIIERGLTTFVEVGNALLRIRTERLYRESHGTFEDYCRDRWQWSRQRANQTIAAAETAAALTTTVVKPASERVARELAPLRSDPDALREVWTEVIQTNGTKPTAEQVRGVVEERLAPVRPEPTYTCCPTCGHRVRADKPLRPTRG